MTEPQDPIHIRVEDVHKSYGENHVLRGVDLLIHRGKTNVVIGGSGAGKTVLLRQLIALERPDRGRILLDGQDVVSLGEVQLNRIRRRFGMVFQASALFDSMTVFENVAFPLREHTRLPGREIRKRVAAKLEVLGLGGTENRMPGEMSGGMRKRAAVARALILEPEILIYDEPTAGLDPIASRNVDRLINDTAEHFRGTSVVISHDMNTTFGVGHYVALLHEGRIRASGRPAEIAASTDPVVRRFLAASGVTPVITHAG
ncbi:MAG: ABC transporter ATP-binding protein [Deltaproteobacteria bacterium]|nr:ABC transporter ATP-binding protein [Deltaproteobacteria bacterium]